MGLEDQTIDHDTETRVELLCPECGERIAVTDIHAFLLGLHQRVCSELVNVNGGTE